MAATGVVGILFLALLAGGGLQQASHWFGEQLVQQMVPAEPAPSEEPQRRRTKRQKTERQDRQ